MRFAFKIGIMLACIFSALEIDRTVNALAAQVPPAAAVSAIKTEDALAISKLNTAIATNLNQKLQLEAIYAQNIAQGRQLNAEIETACATALKNAGADPQKATVDREKLQIVAKPPAPQKK